MKLVEAVIVEPSGAVVNHAFTFDNEQDEPIDLEVTGKNCSCVDVTVHPKKILPNHASKITLTGRLAYSTGSQHFFAIVNAARPHATKAVALELIVPTYARIAFPDPPPNAKLEQARPTVIDYSFSIYGAKSDLQSDAVSIHVGATHVSTNITDTQLISQDDKIFARKVNCKSVFSPEFPNEIPGSGTVPMRVIYGEHEANVFLSFEYCPPIVARPAAILCGTATGNSKKTVTIDGGNTPFKIENVECPDFITYQIVRRSASKHDLVINSNCEVANRETGHFAVKVHTDHPNQPTVFIPIHVLDFKSL